MAAPSTQTINGDLLKIDGEFSVMKDTSRMEVPLHIDQTSQLDGAFKTGGKVEARAMEKDHALSIRHVTPKT